MYLSNAVIIISAIGEREEFNFDTLSKWDAWWMALDPFNHLTIYTTTFHVWDQKLWEKVF